MDDRDDAADREKSEELMDGINCRRPSAADFD
jgi:hypothetical protein